MKYTKTTLAVCLALSLSACGGGSSPEPTPPAPPQADIQFNFPTSIEITRGGDASFAVSLMQSNNNAPSLFELEIVMENGSGIEVVNIAPKDSSGRRLVTLRATDKANLGIARGTISARIGDLVKNLPIMVSIKPAVSGLYNSSFGSNGLAALPIPSGAISNAASDITFDTRGRVLALGYTQLSRGTDIAFTISRFSESGIIDKTFGSDGHVVVNPSDNDERGVEIYEAADGKLLVFGYYGEYFGVMRLLSDGSIDNSYESNGILKLSKAFFPVLSTDMDSKGRVLVSIHNTQYDTTSIFRLNSDGTYDNTFNSITLNIASHLRHYNKIRALSGGEIVFSYVSGEVDQNISIIKILENGTLDGKFGKQGKLDIDLGSSEDILIDTEIDSRDQIVIFGRTKNLNRAIIKLNKNGEAVTSFGESGRLNLDSDKDVLFDELELKNQNIVLYDSYTRGESTAVEIDESGKSKRFNFSRPSNYENGRTTLSKVVWNSRLSRYIGYGDLEISSNSFSDRGVIYSFFE